jgi:hypothetical protein
MITWDDCNDEVTKVWKKAAVAHCKILFVEDCEPHSSSQVSLSVGR